MTYKDVKKIIVFKELSKLLGYGEHAYTCMHIIYPVAKIIAEMYFNSKLELTENTNPVFKEKLTPDINIDQIIKEHGRIIN